MLNVRISTKWETEPQSNSSKKPLYFEKRSAAVSSKACFRALTCLPFDQADGHETQAPSGQNNGAGARLFTASLLHIQPVSHDSFQQHLILFLYFICPV